ncbi:hypothetical protein HOT31_gp064 [Microbacterium phage Hendrix]|uniref:Uncharacterized protein n=1 Tax=Microbacterium phage Hendrix TaxID=2182341 RepID=A0A2U8UU61_9CAUD|nr:hypothetical protein HOT31_gp064 [Microbacterium phage Hendrix]AWN07735.1 hypothetical protein PBI_HENDRIX_64 [Microbacterium phage Hendrix]
MAGSPLPWPTPIQHSISEAMDWVGSALWDIVEQAKNALVPTPQRVIHITPGRQVPWDPEAACGIVGGRVLTMTPITGPKGSTNLPCGVVEYVATVGIQVARCIATVNDSLQAPTAQEIDMDGLQMTRDMANLLQVIQCHSAVRTIGAWNPYGAMGGMAGGEWTFQLRIPVCPCGPSMNPTGVQTSSVDGLSA